jgi:predicted MFS family arabinose efflux permease
LAIVFLALFGAMTSFFLLASVVPLYAATLGGKTSGAGFSTGVLLFAAVAAEIAAPSLVKRWGRRRVVAAGFFLLGAPALLLGTATSSDALIALCAIRGVGFGVLAVAGGALVVSLAAPAQRGYVLGVYGIVATVPAVFALPLGVWLSGHVGFSALFMMGGLAALVGIASAPCVPPEEAGSEELISIGAGFKKPTLIWPAVAFAATAMAAGVITTFLPMMTSDLPAGTAAWGLLIQALTGTLTRWLAGRYGHRFSGYRLLGPSVVLAVGGVLALETAGGTLWVLLSMLLFGAGFGAAQNASLGLMLDQIDARGYDTVNALWNLAYDLGWGTGASGFGLLAARCGFPLAFAVSGAVMLVMLTVAWRQGRAPTAPTGLVIPSPVAHGEHRSVRGHRHGSASGCERLSGGGFSRWPSADQHRRDV